MYTLYLIECENHQKIGLTSNLDNRMRSLSSYGKSKKDELGNPSIGLWYLKNSFLIQNAGLDAEQKANRYELFLKTGFMEFKTTRTTHCNAALRGSERYHKNKILPRYFEYLKETKDYPMTDIPFSRIQELLKTELTALSIISMRALIYLCSRGWSNLYGFSPGNAGKSFDIIYELKYALKVLDREIRILEESFAFNQQFKETLQEINALEKSRTELKKLLSFESKKIK